MNTHTRTEELSLSLSLFLHPVGFEPTHPKITELKSAALDHSAKSACRVNGLVA